MADNDSLGDRMKWYESRFTNDQFMPYCPILARLDGKAFHTFTKGLNRPYDKRLSDLMVSVTMLLVKKTNARCGYTQSDEITLVWLSEDWDSEVFFAGKLQKMNSILASMATAYFNALLPSQLPEKCLTIEQIEDEEIDCPLFDCRVFQVPTEFEASNCFIWREMDATRNSVQMAARSLYSHNQCENKDCSQLHEMMHQSGLNWNDFPDFFKRGTYVRKRYVNRVFTPEELETLPLKHAARRDSGLIVKRSAVIREEFPPLTKIANREEVILHGAEPCLRDNSSSCL